MWGRECLFPLSFLFVRGHSHQRDHTTVQFLKVVENERSVEWVQPSSTHDSRVGMEYMKKLGPMVVRMAVQGVELLLKFHLLMNLDQNFEFWAGS